ncbi:MAG: hypothetical protein U0871_26965 [Gemmataceae bacterium]
MIRCRPDRFPTDEPNAQDQLPDHRDQFKHAKPVKVITTSPAVAAVKEVATGRSAGI